MRSRQFKQESAWCLGYLVARNGDVCSYVLWLPAVFWLSHNCVKLQRVILLCYLVHSLYGFFLLEQPGSSLAYLHPRFQEMLATLQAEGCCNKQFCKIHEINVIFLQKFVQFPCSYLTYSLKIWRQPFWMMLYGHFSPKRTVCYSNSPLVVNLNKGKLTKVMKQQRQVNQEKKKKTTIKYIGKRDGKRKFRGDPETLKESQTIA